MGWPTYVDVSYKNSLAMIQVEQLHERREIGGEVPVPVRPEAAIGWRGERRSLSVIELPPRAGFAEPVDSPL